MKSLFARFCILAGMLLGLPLLGVMLKGLPLPRYLEFPPHTRYVTHAAFSWPVFTGYLVLILMAVVPLFIRGIRRWRSRPASAVARYRFPWWGWIGIVAGLISWILAWTRFPWFEIFQPHTFTPLWLSYIVVINAMTYRQTGRCMMLDRPRLFLILFPLSALFWWFFEYLNRFVQNWYYTGVHFTPWAYFWYATLSFSTVLPAVLGTQEWIVGSAWIRQRFTSFLKIRVPCPRVVAAGVLVVSGAGLAGIGGWPDLLFPLLWVSPLLIIVSLQIIWREPSMLDDMAEGDWQVFVAAASAAVMCGGFWEMWNYYSLAKWEYAVPFVQRYLIFEMPILGFAGYLPFGLECAVIGGIIERILKRG
ncbi:MAG: hypothetical protein JRL30_25470 [Deltaproteobacteria bacterium]|nr:hypothetical protein [Deltaproteobacteria bacterium]